MFYSKRRGKWQVGTKYEKRDTFDHGKEKYITLHPHTAKPEHEPGTGVICDYYKRFRGEWKKGRYYEKNDAFSYKGAFLYIVTEGHEAVEDYRPFSVYYRSGNPCPYREVKEIMLD